VFQAEILKFVNNSSIKCRGKMIENIRGKNGFWNGVPKVFQCPINVQKIQAFPEIFSFKIIITFYFRTETIAKTIFVVSSRFFRAAKKDFLEVL
jgi:hypothetical protein